MTRMRNIVAASMLVALAALTGAVDAQAATATKRDPDGFLFVYNGIYQLDNCDQFDGNMPTWGNCANKSESLWNNGYPGNLDDVLVFWGYNYGGAWRGLYNGALLNNLSEFTFDYSNGEPGHGKPLWHNITSSKWVNL